MSTSYIPINCEFHDLLEMLATTRKVVRIVFRDAEGAGQVRIAKVVDVFSREGAEHLATSAGDLIRLDWLVEVAGVRLADFPTASKHCAL